MRLGKRVYLAVMLALLVPFAGLAVPQLAVLQTVLASGMDPAAAPLITTIIEEEFVNSGKYTVLDRANIEHILKEKEFQLSSGIVRNEEVRQAGEYLGADFVVIGSVSRIGQTYVVTAKIVDVVSGKIVAQTSAEKEGKIDVLLEVARVVGKRLAAYEASAPQIAEPKKEEPVVEKPAPPPAEPEKERVVTTPPPEEKPSGFKQFIVGVKGGLNVAGISAEDWYMWGYSNQTISGEVPGYMYGFSAGMYFVSYFSQWLGLQMDILYSQKGYSIYFYDAGGVSFPYAGNVTSEWTFNYLEVPILLKVRLPGKVSLYGVAGASVAMFLNGTVLNTYDDPAAQAAFENANENPEDVANLPTPLPVNDMEYALVVGAGLDLNLGSFVLNFEARATLGVSQVTDLYFTNNVVSFTAGLAF